MCDTCGCSSPGEWRINPHSHPHKDHHHVHDHSHDHSHGHDHHHDHHHHHADPSQHKHDHEDGHNSHSREVIDLRLDVLDENNRMAERNRGYFEGREIVALNLVSSPGSGKTTILEKTIQLLGGKQPICVIEGDQQTSRDAERILKAGATAVQINTGSGCHLDSAMVRAALTELQPSKGSLLFIENVGNLVCPAMFDLGETARVIVMSVTEGDDKPLKYPMMFESSQLCLINKTDLLPYVDFDIQKAVDNALKINPKLKFIEISARSEEGMDQWIGWLKGLERVR